MTRSSNEIQGKKLFPLPNGPPKPSLKGVSAVGYGNWPIKGAPNKVNAIKLVEFLLSEEAQNHIVNNTFEFPMIDGVSPNPLVVNNLGLDFKQDLKTKVSSYGAKQADALEVMTAAGWK